MTLISILIASLLGSPHCAGMCGGFVAMTSQMQNPRYAQISYHIGRLITYLTLGFLAGIFGKEINQFGSALGIDRFAAVITGSIMILAASTILIGKPLRLSHYIPSSIFHFPSRILSSFSKKGSFYGLFLGLFSTLLPCGWLYTYVAIAAATGSPKDSVLVMAFFWVGTLPILLTIGSIAHLVSAPISKHIPKIVAVLMLIAGFFALSGHLTVFGDQHSAHSPTCHTSHETH